MPRLRILIPAAAALLLTACGSGGGGAATAPSGSAANPLHSTTTPKTASGRSNEASGSAGSKAGSKAGEQSAVAEAGVQGAVAAPCGLVSRSQASAIVGERVSTPRSAAQGPTCIYRSRKSFVTVAVQTLDFAKLKPRLGRPQRVNVSSRTGYCGNYGQQMLYVPLHGGSVLTVAAPCAQAQRFAALAVKRLSP